MGIRWLFDACLMVFRWCLKVVWMLLGCRLGFAWKLLQDSLVPV